MPQPTVPDDADRHYAEQLAGREEARQELDRVQRHLRRIRRQQKNSRERGAD